MHVCVSIPADHACELGLAELTRRVAPADLVEIRLDARPDFPLEWIPRLGKPVIATCRLRAQGGSWNGSEADRMALLRRAVDAGAAWVDLEWKCGAQARAFRPARVLTSHHVLDGLPDDVEGVLREMTLEGGDAIKLVAHARTTLEAVTFSSAVRLALAARDWQSQLAGPGLPPVAAFAMGEAGTWTRVALARLGAPWVYAALDRSRATAPGQPTLAEWTGVLRVHRLGAGTALYGLIGNPVAHSLSPLIHNLAFEKEGIDAIYVPFLVTDPGALPAVLALDVRGFSVTIPYKEAVLPLVDRRSRAATEIGAVNTLVRRGDAQAVGWEGGNTDAAGALAAVARAYGASPDTPFLAGKRALVLGAGGAARAIAWGLARAGARVAVSGRTGTRAEALAREMKLVAVPWDARAGEAPDLLVNTTPVGMAPRAEESPWPSSALHAGMVVFDTVYHPRRTRLLADAKAAGARVVEGIEMLVEQAALQFTAWTGRPMPRAAVEAARSTAWPAGQPAGRPAE
ncbi:MAG: shikimate dehydrogenase [Planctomycetota bacterium]